MMKPENTKPKYEPPTAVSFGELNITSGDACGASGNGASQTGNCEPLGNGASSGNCYPTGNGAHTQIPQCVSTGSGLANPGSVG
jgi:hypothetical protein